ncbi:hypothetical protein BKA70DRAFT_1219072 [Coprinopsis sp. MPI-PUGE-AT-0042]|nr:hypothetical protein BKA70DRAFT_1219072 [Coprinopsis sp. MPI-PUGE-AT-0042]
MPKIETSTTQIRNLRSRRNANGNSPSATSQRVTRQRVRQRETMKEGEEQFERFEGNTYTDAAPDQETSMRAPSVQPAPNSQLDADRDKHDPETQGHAESPQLNDRVGSLLRDGEGSDNEYSAGCAGEENRGDVDDLLATIERLKRQLLRKQVAGQRAREELKDAQERCAELQEELDAKEELLQEAKKNEVQYRDWWLNEIQFTKLLLNKVPNPNRDIDLVRASQAHYLGHY